MQYNKRRKVVAKYHREKLFVKNMEIATLQQNLRPPGSTIQELWGL